MQTRSMTATNNPIVLIHGAPGRGKTTLASRFERPLFFALERGIPSGIEVAAVADADSFEAVLTTLREIYSDGAGDYRTIVFDTLDVLEAHLIEYVCAKYQWKNIEQPAFGKGWIACD